MTGKNDNFKLRTLQIPFTDEEWLAFGEMILKTGLKRQGYARNLILADLSQKGFICNQEQKENQ